jgi:hypothetical protein
VEKIITLLNLLYFIILISNSIIQAQIDTLWTQTYGNSNYDACWSVRQTLDGGYVIAGRTESYGEGLSDVWLIKTDSQGDTLWTQAYGGSSNEHGITAQQTTDGGYIITGSTQSYGAGLYDVWLIKTDDHGDTVWTRTYGGNVDDYGYFVQQTTNGGYIPGHTVPD